MHHISIHHLFLSSVYHPCTLDRQGYQAVPDLLPYTPPINTVKSLPSEANSIRINFLTPDAWLLTFDCVFYTPQPYIFYTTEQVYKDRYKKPNKREAQCLGLCCAYLGKKKNKGALSNAKPCQRNREHSNNTGYRNQQEEISKGKRHTQPYGYFFLLIP